MLANQSQAKARDHAGYAASLGLSHPRLAHLQARNAELAGNPAKARTVIADALATRNASSGLAWTDLLALRDAIQARQVAAARIPSPVKTVQDTPHQPTGPTADASS